MCPTHASSISSLIYTLGCHLCCWQMFSSKTFPLSTLWVDEVNKMDAENKTSFRLISPEETLVLNCPTMLERNAWVEVINKTICSCSTRDETGVVTMRGNGYNLVDQTLEDVPSTPLTERRASHTFRNHHLFKEGIYNGDWVRGQPQGTGSVTCADGRVFHGHFADGVPHGRATLTSPSDVGPVKFVEGEWRQGLLHGFASVLYHNGEKYVGDWFSGKRSGFGILRTLGGHKYVGSWLGDLRHGRGVREDSKSGTKYLGEWADGQRHGKGAIVTEAGLYVSGVFAADRLQGRAFLRDKDNSRFVGEFTSDFYIHGRGVLSLPSGQRLEGHFAGRWTDPSGLKVCRKWLPAHRFVDSKHLQGS